jgi:hypothetical protein
MLYKCVVIQATISSVSGFIGLVSFNSGSSHANTIAQLFRCAGSLCIPVVEIGWMMLEARNSHQTQRRRNTISYLKNLSTSYTISILRVCILLLDGEG